MANKYEWYDNPIKDFFLQNLLNDVDISKKKNFEAIQENLTMFIEHFLDDENDIVYLDFSIKKDKFDGFKIIANNIITALWFSGIIPTDTNGVLKANKFAFDDKQYTFNKKTKVLTTKISK